MALQEHDEKQLYVARQNLIDLRNMYAILTDIVHKNITKVRFSPQMMHRSINLSCRSARRKVITQSAYTNSFELLDRFNIM